ncbi:MAG TPA: histidine phosphatase family protein [bacterium]|nr:histidine phosphatase family protein [bacterium]
MKLYLARHGQAASSEPGVPASLTDQGKRDLALMGRELAVRNLNIEQIWYSPKTRTRQTAEIYAEILGVKSLNMIEKKVLSPDGDIDLLHHEINESYVQNLLVVSHEPVLHDLSSFLGVNSEDLSSIVFPPSGVSAFEKGRDWTWLWLLEPSVLK